jgi:hypothetical protein
MKWWRREIVLTDNQLDIVLAIVEKQVVKLVRAYKPGLRCIKDENFKREIKEYVFEQIQERLK